MRKFDDSICGLFLALVTSACGGDASREGGTATEGGDAPPLQFEGEQEFLPGFELDTGWQPQDAPASIRAQASAHGSIAASILAVPDGESMSALPGSGELSMDGGIDLEVSARIDTSGISYEGVVESFRYEIEPSSVEFDSFMMDDTVDLSVELPPKDLGSVPIPSVPGASLALEVTGGQLDTQFSGTCADVNDDRAQFTAVVTTSGTVACAASIVIDIPLVGEETFGPFDFDIEIPTTNSDMDLGTRAMSTGELVDGASICDESSGDDTGDDTGVPPSDTDGDPDDSGGTSGGEPVDPPPDEPPPPEDACTAPTTCQACIACADTTGGACNYYGEACDLNEGCPQLLQCQNECAALPTLQAQWCTIDCFEAYPDGIDSYIRFASCLADACESECRGS